MIEKESRSDITMDGMSNKHLVRVGSGKSCKFNCRATCHSELAGEGIEYSWALHTKGWSKYQLLGKKRNEVTFQNRVKVCVMRPSTSLKIFDIRWRKLLCRSTQYITTCSARYITQALGITFAGGMTTTILF